MDKKFHLKLMLEWRIPANASYYITEDFTGTKNLLHATCLLDG